MKLTIFVLLCSTLQAQIFSGRARGVVTSTSSPSAAECDSLGEVGAIRIHVQATSSSYYECRRTGASTFTWSLVSSGGAGEANTASNVGASGVGVFDSKVGVDLQMRKILGLSPIVSTLNGSVIELSCPTCGGGGGTTQAGPSGGISVTGTGTGIDPYIVDVTSFVCITTGVCAPTGAQNFSGSSATRPSKEGASDPATCVVGEMFYNTTSNVRKNCTAANTWTAPGGSGPLTVLSAGGGYAAQACNSGGTTKVLATYTIPAATLAVGDFFTVKARWRYNLVGGVAETIRPWIKFGNSEQNPAGAYLIDQDEIVLRLEMTGYVAGATSQLLDTKLFRTTSAVLIEPSAWGTNATSAISGDIVVEIGATCSSAADDEIQLNSYVIERLRP